MKKVKFSLRKEYYFSFLSVIIFCLLLRPFYGNLVKSFSFLYKKLKRTLNDIRHFVAPSLSRPNLTISFRKGHDAMNDLTYKLNYNCFKDFNLTLFYALLVATWCFNRAKKGILHSNLLQMMAINEKSKVAAKFFLDMCCFFLTVTQQSFVQRWCEPGLQQRLLCH